MSDPAALVPEIAPCAVVDREARGGPGVLDEPLQERHRLVPLLEEHVSQSVAQREHAERAHGVDEEGVRAVEGVDEATAVGDAGPAAGLDRPARHQRELTQLALAPLGLVASLPGEAAQSTPGAHVVEPVVVDPHVGDVGGHARERPLAPEIEEAALTPAVELQDCGAELESLRPVGPSSGGVAALDGEDRRAGGRIPALLESEDLLRGQLPHPRDRGSEVRGAKRLVDPDHLSSPATASPAGRGSPSSRPTSLSPRTPGS